MVNPVPSHPDIGTPYGISGPYWASRPLPSFTLSLLIAVAFGATPVPVGIRSRPRKVPLAARHRVVCERVRSGCRTAGHPRARTVLRSGEQLQVGRVHTSAVAADVVDRQAVRYLAPEDHPCDAVRKKDFANLTRTTLDSAVALLGDGCCPRPALVNPSERDLAHPSRFQCHANKHTRSVI